MGLFTGSARAPSPRDAKQRVSKECKEVTTYNKEAVGKAEHTTKYSIERDHRNPPHPQPSAPTSAEAGESPLRLRP